MPPELKAIMEQYERQQASSESAQGLVQRLAMGRHAGVVGMLTAFAIMYLMHACDDVSSELHRAFGLLLRLMGPDMAKRVVLRAASWGKLAKDYDKDDPYLVIEPHEGLRFMTPVGLSAGFDREAVGSTAFLNAGFGFVEVGPISSADEAAWHRITSRDRTEQVIHYGLLGVAVAGESLAELVASVQALGRHVDYFAVDLAALPTALRSEARLREVVAGCVAASNAVPSGRGPSVFLRVPPSASREATAAAAAAALAGGASGLVLCHGEADGDPEDVSEAAVAMIGDVYRQTDGRLVLIASGGIENGRDAMDRIEAGATVVQIASPLLTEGPPACRRMKNEIAQLVANGGYVQMKDAVGVVHRRKKKKVKNVWRAKGEA